MAAVAHLIRIIIISVIVFIFFVEMPLTKRVELWRVGNLHYSLVYGRCLWRNRE